MDVYQVPLGFGMALSENFTAMNAYSAMTEDQKQKVVDRAKNAHSKAEMHQLVSDIANRRIQW